jgi:hypothetical protein
MATLAGQNKGGELEGPTLGKIKQVMMVILRHAEKYGRLPTGLVVGAIITGNTQAGCASNSFCATRRISLFVVRKLLFLFVIRDTLTPPNKPPLSR